MIKYELLILVGIFAFIYSNILTQPTEVLAKLYRFLYKLFRTDNRMLQGQGPHWLFKILIHCEKCVAGQLALWLSIFGNWNDIFINHNSIVILKILLSITFTIFITITIKGIYNKYIKHE